ncbi:MAG: ABC transporter permease [Planctomycetes bacterium]|nr:ABC transporter permease [Planctomycetota bacterium]
MNEKKRSLWSQLWEYEQLALLLTFFALCVVLYLLEPKFLSRINIINVLRQASMTAICSIGMVMLVLLGCIDLSVGSAQAVVGVFTAWIIIQTGSVPVGVIAGLGMGAVIGAVNGLVVTRLRITALIATLGTMSILSGSAMVATKAVSIQVLNPGFLYVGTGQVALPLVGRVPVPVIILLVLVAVFSYILNHTTFGRYLYAIGGNETAAGLAGIPVNRVKMIAFILAGILTGLAAIILSARMNSGQPTAGLGFEMQVIASVVIGGVSMNGGRGTLGGAMIGVLILSVLSNGLVLMDVNSFWQNILRGIVIILAVYLDERRRLNTSRKLLAARFA